MLKNNISGTTSLFDHLRQINRGGVIFLEKGTRTYGMSSAFFKEIYIFPLAASDHVPPFIHDEEYDRDLKDTLIGVFLTDKDVDSYTGLDSDSSLVSSSKRNQPSPIETAASPSRDSTYGSGSTQPLLNTLFNHLNSAPSQISPQSDQLPFNGATSMSSLLANASQGLSSAPNYSLLSTALGGLPDLNQQLLLQQQQLSQLLQQQQFGTPVPTNYSPQNSYNESHDSRTNDNRNISDFNNNNNHNSNNSSNNNYNNNNNNYNRDSNRYNDPNDDYHSSDRYQDNSYNRDRNNNSNNYNRDKYQDNSYNDRNNNNNNNNTYNNNSRYNDDDNYNSNNYNRDRSSNNRNTRGGSGGSGGRGGSGGPIIRGGEGRRGGGSSGAGGGSRGYGENRKR